MKRREGGESSRCRGTSSIGSVLSRIVQTYERIAILVIGSWLAALTGWCAIHLLERR